jgi:predicted O-methyltransferase YrrM
MSEGEAAGADAPPDPRAQVTVEGVTFVCSNGFQDYAPSSRPGVLTLVKSPAMVERFRQLLDLEPGGRIVELGIAFGGSAALLSLLTRPSKLVAVDRAATAAEPLAAFIADHGLEETIKPYYDVDQGDRSRLADLVAAEFGDQPLDLVVDDASHLYGPTRASFECLFPRLRPGGLYLIEDWAWMHGFARSLEAAVSDERTGVTERLTERLGEMLATAEPPPPELPLSRLAVELVLMRADGGALIDSVSVDRDWIAVRRGPASLDPDTFRLDDALHDHFHTLSPPADPLSPSPGRQDR